MLKIIFVTLAVLILASATWTRAAEPGPKTGPLMSILDRFTAADVPQTGSAESEVPPRQWKTIPTPENLPGKGLAQHPMLYIGEGYNKMFLINGGKIIWTYSTGKGGEYDDVWMLSNGNILYSRMDYAEEITPDKKVVWHLNPPKGCEIHSVQPIGLDKVLVMQNGQPPKLMIINIKTGAKDVDHELVAPNPGGAGGTHGQFRRGRITAAGTYLVSWLSQGKVVEYDKDFKEIWSFKTAKSWAAVRLHNGNTLVTDEQLKTVICSMDGNGAGCQLVEVTQDKKVVWALYDWTNVGPCTAVQILDEPGVPENPGDLER